MKTKTKRFGLIASAAMLLAAMAFTPAVSAQDQPAGSPPVVHSGNVNIEFEPAGTQGLPMDRYQAFEQFAQQNPGIVKDLSRNPRLINSETFAKSHPALGDFLSAHPEVKSDFAANPGNYVDMPLAVGASLKKHPIAAQ